MFDVYGDYTGIDLAMMTRTEGSPWERTRHLKGYDAPIPDALIEDYFAADAASGEHTRPEE